MVNYPSSVFLDTNIFIGVKYNFGENGYLSKIKNLAVNGEIKLYTSNIVVAETKAHIELAISQSIHIFKTAHKDISKIISYDIAKSSLLNYIFESISKNSIVEDAIKEFEDFLNEAKVIILDNEGININLIINDYFNFNPPFENKKNKKNEFPDALIISKLKHEFNKDKPIWIISSDKGFKKAFSNQEGYTCLSSIKDFLDIINKQYKIYEEIKEFIDVNKKEICNELTTKIKSDKDISVDGFVNHEKGCIEGYDYTDTLITNICIEEFHLNSIDEINENFVYSTIICEAKITASCFYNLLDSDMFLEQRENKEVHKLKFESSLILKIDTKNNSVKFSIYDISYNLILDQSSRVDRSELEDFEDFVEYYNH